MVILKNYFFHAGIHVLVNVSVEFHTVHGLRLTLNDIGVNFTIGALAQQKQRMLDLLVKQNPGFVDRIGNEYLTKNKRLEFEPGAPAYCAH